MSIARGKRAFVQISAMGEVDDKDKAVLSLGYKGKWIAKPDHPLAALGGGLIRELLTFARWTSVEAMKADVNDLIDLVTDVRDRAEFVPPSAKPAEPTGVES